MVAGSGRIVTRLGGAAGLGETALPRSDDGSLAQDWTAVFERGLNFYGTVWRADRIHVNTNGTISLGAPFSAYPTAGNAAQRADVIAPFWSDIDTRLRGEGRESGQIWIGVDPVADVVSVTWSGVASYRRNTEQLNTFQLQFYDRGRGDFDIVFRYDTIRWTAGMAGDDAGARAWILARSLPGPVQVLPGAGPDTHFGLDGILGNTGVAGLWVYEVRGGRIADAPIGPGMTRTGSARADTLEGGPYGDVLFGGGGDDVLRGNDGHDTLYGGDGADTLNGGAGDDLIFGGSSEADLRDVIYGGPGNDSAYAGHGNDLVFGGDGNDFLDGGFGSDTLQGQDGDDRLNGGPGSDVIFGGAGDDFINGGFGHDRLNGGAGADTFYHLGIASHGSDWIQDYSFTERDVLMFGTPGATRGQFQVNFNHTANDAGQRAGSAHVMEAFVIYRPTGQIIWALVDGGAEAGILLQLGGQVHNLL